MLVDRPRSDDQNRIARDRAFGRNRDGGGGDAIATRARACRADRRRRRRERRPNVRAASAGADRFAAAESRAIRAALFPMPNSTSSPPRCASAASSSRSSCGRCAAPPTAYEIIAGERRWRAAQRAGLHEVPVVVIEATDAEALQIAIIENVQRADLNPLEEAEGYRALMDEFGNSQDEIAKIVGKSRSHVANTLRLLKLPDTVKAHIHMPASSPPAMRAC